MKSLDQHGGIHYFCESLNDEHNHCEEQCKSCIDECDSCALDVSFGFYKPKSTDPAEQEKRKGDDDCCCSQSEGNIDNLVL